MVKKPTSLLLGGFITIIIIISACNWTSPPVLFQPPALNTPIVVVTRTLPDDTPSPPPTTPPLNTPTPSVIPTETAVPTPTLHPMTIEAMRLMVYPGSEIITVEELERGLNYSRYHILSFGRLENIWAADNP
jgi:hypothetical protein